MKYLLALFTALTFIGCGVVGSSPQLIDATVYQASPTSEPYNMFQVIESDDFHKPEINIHYGEYIDRHPDKRSTIETDTIDVVVQEYTSEYGSIRYRLVSCDCP